MSVLNVKDNTWNEFINQVDTGEEISGGINGNANIATRQLAENIFFIKRKMYELAQSKNNTLSESQRTEFSDMINSKIDDIRTLMSEYKDLADSEIEQVTEMIRDEVNVSLEKLDEAVKDNANKSVELSEKIDNEISNAMDGFQDAINAIEASDEAVEKTIRTVLGARYQDGKSPLEMTLSLLLQEETVRAEKDLAQAKRIDILQSNIGGEYEAFKTWKYYEDSEDWVGGIYHPEEYSLKVLNSELSSPSFVLDGGKFNHVKLRIKRIGSPTWKGKLLWNGRSETEFKDIEEPLDWNNSNFITLNIDIAPEWRNITINNIYFKFTDKADTSNYFIIDWISIGRNTPGISTAQIATIENTITKLDSAIAERLTTIEADLVIPGSGYGEGSYNEWIASTIGPEGSQTKQLETLKSKWQGAEGFESVTDIIKNLETKTTADEARALSNETITAKFGNLTKDDLTPVIDSYGEYVDKIEIVAGAQEATAEKLEGLSTKFNKSSTDFNERLTTQSEENSATAKLVTSLTARTKGVEGSISSIEGVIVNDDGTGLAQRMDNLELDIDGEDGIKGRIRQLDKVVSENNTTTVQRIADIELKGKGYKSSITSLESIVDLENENSLITSRFNSIDSKVGKNSGSIDSLERIVDMGNDDSVIVTRFNDLNAKTDSAIGSITKLEEVVVGPNNSIVTQLSNLDGRTAATEGNISELKETTNTLTKSITENNRELSSRFNIIEDIEIVPGYSSLPEYYENRWGDILERRTFNNKEDLKNYNPDLNGTDLGKSKEIKKASDLGISTHTGSIYLETSVPSIDELISEMVTDKDGNVTKPAVYEYKIDVSKSVEQIAYTDTGRIFTRNSNRPDDSWSKWFEIIDTSAYTDMIKVATAILYGTAANTNSVISVKEKTYADMETSMSEIVTDIKAEVDGNASKIKTITKTYATKDYVGGEITSEIDNKFKTKNGVVTGSLALELKKAWSDDFASTSEKLENFVADYDGNLADVIQSVKAYADTDSSTATALQKLTAGYDGRNLAKFEEDIKIYADELSSSAKKIDTLTAGYEGLTLSKFEEEIKLYADSKSASAEKLDSLTAGFDKNLADFESEIKLYADSESASAEKLESLTANFGNKTLADFESDIKLYADSESASAKKVDIISIEFENAKANISRMDTAISNNKGTIAQTKTELSGSFNSAIADAKTNLESYARDKASDAQDAAETYALAKAKAEADAALVTADSNAQTKANAAESAAKAAAALDAKNKADKALAAAKLDATAKADAAKLYAKGLADTLTTTINSKADITRVEKVVNDVDKALAEAKIELKGDYSTSIAELSKQSSLDAQTKADKALADASAKAVQAQAAAETYALAQANAKAAAALGSAKSDATTKANKARADAELAAALDAKNKADNALRLAKLDAAAKVKDVQDTLDELAVVVDSKASITRVDKVANDANRSLAEAKTEITGGYTSAIKAAETASAKDATTKANKALADAKQDSANKVAALRTVVDSKASITSVEKVVNDAEKALAIVEGKVTSTYSKALEEIEGVTKYIDSEVGKLNTTIDSKADINTVNKVVSDANKSLAELKTTITGEYAKAIGTSKTASALDAKSKADKALADAKTDATTKANAAKDAAAAFAKLEAKAKADAALVLASDDATAKANAAKSAAELAAAKDAKAKADKALTDAKADASTKASAAEKAAKEYADAKAKGLTTLINSKADISRVDTIENTAVKSLASAKTELTGSYTKAIKDIEVGGRNLYVLSATVNGHESAGKIENSTAAHKTMPEPILVKGHKFITYQHWNPSKWVNSANTNRIGFLTESKAHITSVTLPKLTTKEYEIILITVPENAHYALLGAIVNPSDLNAVKIKYEFGNKATDWTPAPEDVTDYVDTNVRSLKTLVDSKANISRVDTVENNAKQALASAKTELTGSYTKAIATAKSQSATDAQTRATKALNDAKADTVLKANEAQSAAKTYALAEAKSKAAAALVSANSDATTKANAAKSAAEAAAALDAKNKADKALADAKLDAKAKADEALKLAKAHADTKVSDLTKIVNSKASIASVEKVENTASKALASLKTDLTASYSIADTRNTNETPAWYQKNHPIQVVREFKASAKIGIPGSGYTYLETTVKYGDPTGGNVTQQATADGGNVYNRSGKNTAWSAWVEQEDTKGSAAKVAALKTALDKDIKATDARITAEKKVAANATSAVASTVSKLSTTVNGHTSSINETKTSLNGISAKWAMETNVNGKVSGIYQHSTGKKSGLDIITDKFTLSNGTNAGTAPFRQEGNTTYLNMAVIKKASIATAMIGNAQVDSLQIKGNAVSIPVFYNNPAQVQIKKEKFNTWVTVGTAVLPSNESSTSLSLGIGLIKTQQNNGDNPGKSKNLLVAIFKNGALLRQWKLISHNAAVGWTGWEHEPLYFPSILDTVITTSKVTYEVRVKGENFRYNGGSYATGNIQVTDVTLIAMGMKR